MINVFWLCLLTYIEISYLKYMYYVSHTFGSLLYITIVLYWWCFLSFSSCVNTSHITALFTCANTCLQVEIVILVIQGAIVFIFLKVGADSWLDEILTHVLHDVFTNGSPLQQYTPCVYIVLKAVATLGHYFTQSF